MTQEAPNDARLLQAILDALASPSAYTLDGESISNRTPEELARLIAMARALSAKSAATPRAPFRVAVQNCNRTHLE